MGITTRDATDLFPFWKIRSTHPPLGAKTIRSTPPIWGRKMFSKKGGFQKKSRFFRVSRDPFLRKKFDPNFFFNHFLLHFSLRIFSKFPKKILKRRLRRRKTHFRPLRARKIRPHPPPAEIEDRNPPRRKTQTGPPTQTGVSNPGYNVRKWFVGHFWPFLTLYGLFLPLSTIFLPFLTLYC